VVGLHNIGVADTGFVTAVLVIRSLGRYSSLAD
jgi:hypothetical protein